MTDNEKISEIVPMSKITILGSGSTNLNPARNASSVLIRRGGNNIVFDFGRGTAIQLAKIGLLQDDVQHVILSHYHPDHVTDLLPYLHAASQSQIDKRTKSITIYGQPSVSEFMTALKQPYGDNSLSKDFQTTLLDINTGTMAINGKDFFFTDLHHSYGLSFEENGATIAVMADSKLHDDLVDALENVDLGIFDGGHLSDEEIVELAVRCKAKRLVCSHQYRELDGSSLNSAARSKGYKGEISVAFDLMEFEI